MSTPSLDSLRDAVVRDARNLKNEISQTCDDVPSVVLGPALRLRDSLAALDAATAPMVQWKDRDDPYFKSMNAADENRVREIAREEIVRVLTKATERFTLPTETP